MSSILDMLEKPERCPYCGSDKSRIYVHGHFQCADCKSNVGECCQGQPIEQEEG